MDPANRNEGPLDTRPTGTDAQDVGATVTVEQWVYFDYASHEDAIDHFKGLGVGEIEVYADHTPTDFCETLKGLLQAVSNVKMVVDLTPKCPTASSGNLVDWIKTLRSAKTNALARDNVAFVAYRTPENTPAFVHTLGYGAAIEAQHQGVDTRVHNPFASQSAVGIVFHRDRELCIPARLGCGSAASTADCVATMLEVGHDGFACAICHASFVVWTPNAITGRPQQAVEPFLMTECDHLFHAECAVDVRINSGRTDAGLCPSCDTQLPWTVVPEEAAQPELGENCHYLGMSPITPELRAAQEAARRWTMSQRRASSQRATYNHTALARLSRVQAQLQAIV